MSYETGQNNMKFYHLKQTIENGWPFDIIFRYEYACLTNCHSSKYKPRATSLKFYCEKATHSITYMYILFSFGNLITYYILQINAFLTLRLRLLYFN